MIGDVLMGVRIGQWAALSRVLSLTFSLGLCLAVQTASAADCPGHPGALGTSRTLVVDPREHPRIGTMQYPETLPLEDHEVVLTFDDGPLPRNSNQILEILASQCVKATFFEIGRMAQSFPEGVRKLRDAGHSIGTHSQSHPLTMNKMSIERAKAEIDDGIASVRTALGDDAALAPFFRIPGLLRAEGVEEYLASQGIQTWSADFPADDWHHISSSRVYDLAIQRLEAKGKGILLLHDIQARTVAALPRILLTLKERGYRIVHVVPATSELPATPTEPQQWHLHPTSENVAISHWPKIPNFVFADPGMLPAPAQSDADWQDGQLAERFARAGSRAHGIPLPRQAPWPRQFSLPVENASITLPAPAPSVFKIPEGSFAVIARSLHRAEPAARTERDTKLSSADDREPRRTIRGKRHAGRDVRGASRDLKKAGRSGQRMAVRGGGHGNRQAAHGHRGPLKRLVQVKKRNV